MLVLKVVLFVSRWPFFHSFWLLAFHMFLGYENPAFWCCALLLLSDPMVLAPADHPEGPAVPPHPHVETQPWTFYFQRFQYWELQVLYVDFQCLLLEWF